MIKVWIECILIGGGLAMSQGSQAQDGPEARLWRSIGQIPQNLAPREAWLKPEVFRAYNLDHAALRPMLKAAPRESDQPAGGSPAIISLPMPDGTTARFRFVESPVMAPELAAKFPEIKTYLGQGIDDPAAVVRFDSTAAGLHAQVLSPHGAVYIEPHFRGDTNLHVCYYKRDYRRAAEDFQCLTPAGESLGQSAAAAAPLLVSSGNLRTYRLACAATGEYTQYHGGTVAAGLAAIVTAINRVSGIYESELGIRLVLVANNNLIVYPNPSTDPYNNGNPTALLSQNQSNLDYVIGSANYDIGHVFGTGGGGLAGLGVVCVTGSKARGETGTYPPTGDAFWVDYVAHEMGHQFGAHHTFNSSGGSCGGGNRNAATAYEPGGGSTIMAYAGICGADNLQPHSDPYFHSASLDEIINYTTSGAGSSCPVVSATGNNPPNVSAGASFTIPKGTPFTLSAAGSDPDGDTVTYCWEERDLGPSITLGAPDNGSSPLFRSFSPTASPARTFPQLSSLLNNTVAAGELLPSASRTLNIRVTVRDNRVGGGAISSAETLVTVSSNTGPFVVTSPNTAVTWSNVQTVTWNVAGTASLPVSTTNVNILLSTNGGLSFPIVLAANVPNAGAQTVILPSLSCTTCRIRVEAVGNIFFDLSDTDFTLQPYAPVSPPVLAPIANRTIHLGSTLNITNRATEPGFAAEALRFTLDPGAPAGASINPTNGLFVWQASSAYANTTNPITIRVANDSLPGLSDAKSFAVTVLSPPAFGSIAGAKGVATMTWSAITGQTYRVQYKESLNDTNWTDLAPDITATGPSAAKADPLGPAAQRFYRILVLP